MNGQIETPEAAKTKKPSALTEFLAKNKDKKVNETDKKTTGAKFKKLMGEREKIVASLKKFDEEAQTLSEQMIACYGASHIVVDGVKYIPTSRNGRVFYKTMGDESETVEL